MFRAVILDETLWKLVTRHLSSADSANTVLQLLLAMTSIKEIEICDVLWTQMGIWGVLPRLFVLCASPPLCESILLILGNLCGAAPYFPFEINALASRAMPRGSRENNSPQPYAAILQAAQRRANLEIGLLESSGSCSTAAGESLAGLVLQRERDLRQTCLSNGLALLVPALSQQYGAVAMIAGLRLAQVILRDAGNISAGRDLVLRSSCEFVDLMPTLDLVSNVIALDVLGMLVTGSNSPLFQKGVKAACGLVQCPDAFISQKALEAVLLCSQHGCYHALIGSIALGPTVEILCSNVDAVSASGKMPQPLRQRSLGISRTALSILQILVSGEASARAALSAQFMQTFVSALSQAFPAINPAQAQQSPSDPVGDPVSPFFGKVARESFSLPQTQPSDHVDVDTSDVTRAFMEVFRGLCRHTNLRQPVLALGAGAVLIRLLEAAFAKDAAESVVPIMNRLSSALHEHDFSRVASLHSPFGPLCRGAVESLYFLSTHEGDEIADALRSAGNVDVCRLLVYAWAYGGDDLSSMAATVLMRCGTRGRSCATLVRTVPDDGFFEAAPAAESSALPWAYLVQQQQLFVLFDIVSGSGSAQQRASLDRHHTGMACLDMEALLFAQSAACACLRLILDDDAAQVPPEGSAVGSGGGGGGLSLVEGAARSTPVRRAILELCASHGLMDALEGLALRSLDAAVLLADVFCWPEVNFRYSSLSFLDTVHSMLQAHGTLSSPIPDGAGLQAMRILAAALQHSDECKMRVLVQAPRQATCLALQKIMSTSLEGNPHFPQNLQNGRSANARSSLGMCTVIIVSLFEPAGHAAHGDVTEIEAAVLSSTCDHILAALRTQVENGKIERNSQDGASEQSLWAALGMLSREKRCAEALLDAEGAVLQLVISFLSSTAAVIDSVNGAAVLAADAEDTARVTLDHFRRILSNLTSHFEERVATCLVNNSARIAEGLGSAPLPGTLNYLHTICHFISLALHRASEREIPIFFAEAAEALMGLLHAWSCASVPLCASLVTMEADMEADNGEIKERGPFLRHCAQVAAEACASLLRQPLNGPDALIFAEPASVAEQGFAALGTHLSLFANICRCPKGRETIFFLGADLHLLRALPAFAMAMAGQAQATAVLSAAMTLYQALSPLLHQSFLAATREVGLSHLHPRLTQTHCKAVNTLMAETFVAVLAVARVATDLVLVEQALSCLLLFSNHGDVFPALNDDGTVDAVCAVLNRLLPTNQLSGLEDNNSQGGGGGGGEGSQAEETTLKSLACDKCLRLVQHCMRAIEANYTAPDPQAKAKPSLPKKNTPVLLSGRDLVASVMRVLMGAPRTMDNLPGILRAGEVLQQLVLDEACAAEFQQLKQSRGRVQIMPGSTLRESPAALLDTVRVINTSTQAQKLPPSRSSRNRKYFLPL